MKKKNKKLVKKYLVRSFPWGYFIDAEGKDIGPRTGLLGTENSFLSLLEFIVTDAYHKDDLQGIRQSVNSPLEGSYGEIIPPSRSSRLVVFIQISMTDFRFLRPG